MITTALFSLLCALCQDEPPPAEARGVLSTSVGVGGFTLISPLRSHSTFLIDSEGQVRHRWDTEFEPGLAPYLLPTGRLLRGIQMDLPAPFRGGGKSGGLQELGWDGELTWEYHFATGRYYHHHDIEPLPDGNLLMIAWEFKTAEEAIARGRDPATIGDGGFWPCFLLEIEPLRPFGARVVWEWHVWDHLIQDFDSTLPNFGVVSEHPERIDINAGAKIEMTADERRRLIQLGYLSATDEAEDPASEAVAEGGGDDDEERRVSDWLHLNGVDYDPVQDQIVLSTPNLCEIWILDHSTTTAEAAGKAGGLQGRGGDLLYRWGNPASWKAADASEQQLFYQHDPQWIPQGFPGAGDITIFNNGPERGEEEYSTVVQITLPRDQGGGFQREEGEPFGPAEPSWTYDPQDEERFFASFISGAHRLRNGNTLVCSGPDGELREVSEDGAIRWRYRNPYGSIKDRSAFAMFRATRIEADHPGLADRNLVPLESQPKTVAQLMAERPSEPETRLGWVDLLDGGQTERWRDMNCLLGETFEFSPDPDNAEQEILRCSGIPTGLIRSDRMYENFLLEFEWRHMDEPSNAGLFLWADPVPAVGGPFTRGIEVQICNLGNGSWFTSHGDLFPIWGATMTPDPRFRASGSRSMPREDSFHVRPTGEWNHYRISAVDGSVTLEVNGHLVSAGTGCRPSKGYLCLESEGGEVHFRRMRLWELPTGTHAAGPDRTALEASGFKTLYGGLDLEEWTLHEGSWAARNWRVECAAEPARAGLPVPEDWQECFLDFQRSEQPKGARLPLRVGGRRFPAEGEQAGQWNRVVLRRRGTSLEVEFAGETTELDDLSDWTLELCNDGAALSYCSLFSR